jgi:hypothetical protein
MPPVDRGKKRKPRRPSATQRARAQQRSYVSQGRAVEHVAHQQQQRAARAPSRRPVAFRSLPKSNAPFRVQQQRQRRQTARTESRVGNNPKIPHVPLLPAYTPRQQKAVQRIYRKAAKDAGVRNPLELYALGSTSQRRQMTKVSQRVRHSNEIIFNRLPAFYRGAYGPRNDPRDRRAPNLEYHSPEARRSLLKTAAIELPQLLTSPTATVAAGLRGRAQGNVLGPFDAVKAIKAGALTAANVAVATAESPAQVGKTSLRTARESIAGIPQGIKMLADDPVGALEAMAKDYETRYGSVLKNPKKFREMVKDEYGLTPYLLDATAVAGGAGQAAGAVARTSAFGKLARLPGAAGRAARVLHEATKAERPRLRFSAGEAGTRAQRTSKNLLVGVGQHRLDRRRAARYRKQVAKAGFVEREGGRLARQPGREALPDRLPGLRTGPGEVVGRGLREAPGLRAFTGRVARDIGSTKSTSRLAMLTHRSRVMKKVDKATRHLSEDEKLALPVMLRFGIKPGEKGIAALKKRLKSIDTEKLAKLREEFGFDDEEVQILRQIAKDPDRYLTQDARAAASELRDIQIKEGSSDPSLNPVVEETRRLAAQAELLGVPRQAPEFEKSAVRWRAEAQEKPEATAEWEKGVAARRNQLTPKRQTTGIVEFERLYAKNTRAAAEDARRLGLTETAKHFDHLAQKIERVTDEAAEAARRTGHEQAAKDVLMREWPSEWRGPEPGPLVAPETAWFRPRPQAKNPPVGRGFIDQDGVVHTWEEGQGTHDEVARARGVQKAGAFNIRADGTIVGAGGKMPEHETIQKAIAQDPRLRAPGGPPLKSGQLAPDTTGLEKQLAMLEDVAEQQRMTKDFDVGGKRVLYQEHANKLRQKIDDIRAGKDVDQVTGPDWRDAPDETFHQRVRAAAKEAGLDEPAYWMSTADQESGARLAAVGSGFKATERNRQASGGLFRIGAERQGLDVFNQGIERNIKRRYQWLMVSRNIETHAYEWSRNNGQGSTFAEIVNDMRQRRIDPDSVDFIPASIVKRRPVEEAGMARGAVVQPEKEFDDIHQAIRERKTFDQLANEDVQGAPFNHYFVVPKEVGEVLESTTKASGGLARSLEVILKQKPSRIMLGALNVPWLSFQVMSNGLLTGLGGGLRPWDIYGAMKYFNGLDDDAKIAIEAELGITHGHHFAMDQPQLGDTKMAPGLKHLSDFYRGYKRTKVGRGLHAGNPLDAMFRMDEAQNNFFRKVLFYSKAKKDAYRRMGKNWSAIDEAQGNLIERVFKLPPHEQVSAVAANADLFAKHADHVREWLGDYTRFSNSERKLLSANVMFYGYLRFSLRFAFHTMPVRHPIMLNILGNIGRLGSQEIKDLFGAPSDYALPTSALAQVYFGNREDAKKGTLRSVNWGRLNPFLNTITQIEQEQQAIGLVSPIYQALADQLFEESSFTGREWRIKGQPTPSDSERPPNYFGSALSLANPAAYSVPGLTEGHPRNRILERSLLSMAFPYRVAAETGIPGVVDPIPASSSDDSLLWQQYPFHYKDPEAKAGVAKARRTQKQMSIRELLMGQLVPPLQPRPTALPAVIKRRMEQEADVANRAQGKSKKRTKKRYSGGTSSRYGGGSSNRYGG